MKKEKSTAYGELQALETRIKEALRSVLPEDVYNTWIDNFVFERIDSSAIVVAYYGSEPLSGFKKHKQAVWLHICSIAGYSKKLKIRKKKARAKVGLTPKAKKHIRVANLLVLSAFFVAVAASFAVVMCSYVVNRNFCEKFYTVSTIKVDSPIRVIHLSDLHNCSFGAKNEKLISRISLLKPDVIICTGDMLDSKSDETDGVVSLCAALSEIAPSYYIYGNNEVERFYDVPLNQTELDKKFGFNDETRDASKLLEIRDAFEEELSSAGVKVLKNEKDTIEVGTTKIDVFGVLTSNPSAFWSYSGSNFGDYIYSDPDNIKITAIHEPVIFEEFTDVDSWGDLMLCGHTHGGTVRIPIIGPLYTHERGLLPERKGYYAYGRKEVAGRPLIISSGLLNNSIFRINNQPELVIVDINKF